jgi:hypothetical protein
VITHRTRRRPYGIVAEASSSGDRPAHAASARPRWPSLAREHASAAGSPQVMTASIGRRAEARCGIDRLVALAQAPQELGLANLELGTAAQGWGWWPTASLDEAAARQPSAMGDLNGRIRAQRFVVPGRPQVVSVVSPNGDN